MVPAAETTDNDAADNDATAKCESIPFGIEQMTRLESLPLLRPDVQVHYEGSIDKRGLNADWDWWLYRDEETQEWVLCEADGPGCLWNFVAHHALGHSDPVYRFYFDGSDTPAFEIKHSEFGIKYPFVAPLADKFVPRITKDPRLNKIGFRIVRSFCPMPFAKSMKITSSVKLEGNHTTGGGWGHAIWHGYSEADGIRTFTGKEDCSKLIDSWKHCGRDPKSKVGTLNHPFSETIKGKTATTVFEKSDAGSVSGICLRIEPGDDDWLGRLWIRIIWDGEAEPAVECPIGAFFGNEIGRNRVKTIMQGTRDDGLMYCYWPMPFWKSAKIELENRGPADSSVKVVGAVEFKPSSVVRYPRNRTGHFRASAYQSMIHKPAGRDSHIATVEGSGHMVAGVITARETMCEGDVRVHIDGCKTPAIESDGSESWACYGWGFEFPPQDNPASSYDGYGNAQWSMLRQLTGDFYPFRTRLRMTVEGGNGVKQGADLRSGIVFWYGRPKAAMVLTDLLDVGDPDSEKAHDYSAPGSTSWELTSTFEGEFDDVPITDNGRTLAGHSEFVVKVDPKNRGVLLRRRSDQQKRTQGALVFVDDTKVKRRNWYHPDRNPNFRWLEDEFLIPADYTQGKTKVRIRIEPVAQDKPARWNESKYWIYSLGDPDVIESSE